MNREIRLAFAVYYCRSVDMHEVGQEFKGDSYRRQCCFRAEKKMISNAASQTSAQTVHMYPPGRGKLTSDPLLQKTSCLPPSPYLFLVPYINISSFSLVFSLS